MKDKSNNSRDKENSVKGEINIDMSFNIDSYYNNSKVYNFPTGKELGNRLFTPKLRDIQNLPRCQTSNFFNFDTMRTPTNKLIGPVGTFDANGDFYFNNDRELHRVQQYFGLFYHNRVEY